MFSSARAVDEGGILGKVVEKGDGVISEREAKKIMTNLYGLDARNWRPDATIVGEGIKQAIERKADAADIEKLIARKTALFEAQRRIARSAIKRKIRAMKMDHEARDKALKAEFAKECEEIRANARAKLLKAEASAAEPGGLTTKARAQPWTQNIANPDMDKPDGNYNHWKPSMIRPATGSRGFRPAAFPNRHGGHVGARISAAAKDLALGDELPLNTPAMDPSLARSIGEIFDELCVDGKMSMTTFRHRFLPMVMPEVTMENEQLKISVRPVWIMEVRGDSTKTPAHVAEKTLLPKERVLSVYKMLAEDEIGTVAVVVKANNFPHWPLAIVKSLVNAVLAYRGPTGSLKLNKHEILRLPELRAKLEALFKNLGITDSSPISKYVGKSGNIESLEGVISVHDFEKACSLAFADPDAEASAGGNDSSASFSLMGTVSGFLETGGEWLESNTDVNASLGLRKLWTQFRRCDDMVMAARVFREIKKLCGVGKSDFNTYGPLREKVGAVEWSSKELFKFLDERLSQREYTTKFLGSAVPKVVVVGAGPGGLRMAIEARLLGCRVFVLEQRMSMARNNQVRLWDAIVRDCFSIGIKHFYPRFCAGMQIMHTDIKGMQLALLKIALVVGAEVFAGAKYMGHSYSEERGSFMANIHRKTAKGVQEIDTRCDVLIGADGARSSVVADFQFEEARLNGALSIGITFNFTVGRTKGERDLKEGGWMSYADKAKFGALRKLGIDLENLVYYLGKTHYFVVTATRESLVNRGVIKRKLSPGDPALLSSDNIDRERLETYARDVATEAGLPTSVPFVKTRGRSDIAIFDFSNRREVRRPAMILEESKSALLVTLVGDALEEPFWPQGTGVNHAVLSAMDAAWKVKTFTKQGRLGASFIGKPLTKEDMLASWKSWYHIMKRSRSSDLIANYSLHTIDPATRYARRPTG